MTLTSAQKQQLRQRGYVKIPAVVPGIMVKAALRAINHSVGQGMDVADMNSFRARSYCPELQREPVITDLINRTPAWSLIESALGEGRVRPASAGQIALRFPMAEEPTGLPGPHLDGVYTPHNGVPEGEIQSFTSLVCILLSDVNGPEAGNFTVWPGSHLAFQEYFRARSPQSLLQGVPQLDLEEPEQVEGKAGDMVLCHYQVGHTVAPNTSPHVRYAVFFRLHHVDHESHKWEAMTDIWRAWEGLRAAT